MKIFLTDPQAAVQGLRARTRAFARALGALFITFGVVIVPSLPTTARAASTNGASSTSSTGGTLQVGATILVSCTMTGTVLDFGTGIDPLSSAATSLDASSTFGVTCTNTTPYTVALSAGQNAGGGANFGARAMKSGSHTLPYQLYLDAGRGTVWGNGQASGIYSGTGTGNPQSLTIYGRLNAPQRTAPGSYSDTVTVTISY